MARTCMRMLPLAVMLAAGGCDESVLEESAAQEPYVIRRVDTPLSPEDIRDAFGVLGLRIERYDYTLPQAGKLHLTTRRYFESEFVRDSGRSTISVDAGRQQLTIFMERKEGSLSFDFGTGGARLGWGSIDVSEYGAWTSGSLAPGKLEPRKKVPLFAYAASDGELSGLTPRPVEQLADEYPLLVVVFAELRPDDQP